MPRRCIMNLWNHSLQDTASTEEKSMGPETNSDLWRKKKTFVVIKE